MIYECMIQYITIDTNGNDKIKREKFIVSDAQTFSDVETLLYESFGDYTDLDIPVIKRSKIKEIVNERTNDNEKVYIATLTDTFVDDNGEEKESKYLIAFYAEDIDCAYNYIKNYIKQGYNLSFVALRTTKYIDVI